MLGRGLNKQPPLFHTACAPRLDRHTVGSTPFKGSPQGPPPFSGGDAGLKVKPTVQATKERKSRIKERKDCMFTYFVGTPVKKPPFRVRPGWLCEVLIFMFVQVIITRVAFAGRAWVRMPRRELGGAGTVHEARRVEGGGGRWLRRAGAELAGAALWSAAVQAPRSHRSPRVQTHLGTLQSGELGRESIEAGPALVLDVCWRAVDAVELRLGVLVRGDDRRELH